MNTIDMTLTVNEKKQILAVKPNDTLLEVIRDYLDLTGSKEAPCCWTDTRCGPA